MGLTLNEYALATLKGEKRVAGKTEEGNLRQAQAGLHSPPELRENTGEIEAAGKTHFAATADAEGHEGRPADAHDRQRRQTTPLREMAKEAKRLGHEYIAITDHSKAVTVANGLDEKRRRGTY